MTSQDPPPSSATPRKRIREIYPSIRIGRHTPGPLNSIVDVPGVLVHTQSIQSPSTSTTHAINTGITTILPRKNWFESSCYAGLFSFNGSGELTGSHWINETGLLCSPILLTNSFSVGACYSGIYEYIVKNYNDKNGLATGFLLPVVGETFDGYLNDIGKMAVTSEMAVKGIESATSEKVKEGNTGGGTGMLCHGFKGGTGSASRVVEGLVIPSSTSSSPQSTSTEGKKEIFTIAALVQSNYGKQQDLKIGGVPVGRLMQEKGIIAEWETTPPTPLPPGTAVPGDGSIIVILATSAPLNPLQLQRLAKRATVGLSRVGGWGANFSGDIFLAFSTATEIPSHANTNPWVPTVQQKEGGFVLDESINALFEAAADVTEEAIYNALCMAEDCIGPLGHKGNAIPLEILREMLERWHVP